MTTYSMPSSLFGQGPTLAIAAERPALLLGAGGEPVSRFREFLDWLKMVKRHDDSVEIQIHVLVDEHVPESRQRQELPDQGW